MCKNNSKCTTRCKDCKCAEKRKEAMKPPKIEQCPHCKKYKNSEICPTCGRRDS